MKNKITIFDTTLRDGEQGEGISFTVEDKLAIVHLLDDLGVDYIEGGWPGSNPKAVEFFDRMKQEKLKNAKLVSFGSTMRKASKKAEKDMNLKSLIETNTPAVCIFGKAWDLHVLEIFKISLEDNLRLITESVKFLKDKGKEVIFDAEHFFDGYKENQEYALKVLEAALSGGADILSLCDTNGGCLPFEIEDITVKIKESFPEALLGVHFHNDSGCSVANSLAAVRAGVRHVQGTINGIGERCGNADLSMIIPGLQLKMGFDVLKKGQLQNLTNVAHHISEIANQTLSTNHPYVGYSAFTHKAGVHVNAIQKNKRSYEHLDPELVGNRRRVLISELSGKSNLLVKAEAMGVDLSKNSEHTKELLEKIKELEHYGYQFEEGEASFEVLVKRQLGEHKPLFELINLHVFNEKHNHKEDVIVEASLKIKIKNEIIHTVSDGNGPVDAMDKALRLAIERFYPEITNIYLADYKVRVLDSKDGAKAAVRVIIKSTDGKDVWGTVGVSSNIIEASWQALVDSIEYRIKG